MTSALPATQGGAAAPAARNQRRVLVGRVVSCARQKTITVEVERLVRHRSYEKFVRRRRKLHAHDERNEAKPGDRVELMATRPLSKQKRWRLVRILAKAEE
jgi:small subunit ribosomal protein S17